MAWQFDDERPIYTQLLEKIRVFIISGQYPPGSKLPPVRELAAEASVNPNTMQRAFAQLEQEGLLHTQRTSGRFVTEDRDRIMSIKEDLAKGLVADFLRSMKELGYSDSQTITMLESASLGLLKDEPKTMEKEGA